MKLVPLNRVFKVVYGNQLDLNKMETDPKGINFISRSSRNLGFAAKVCEIEDKSPFEAGLITVTLGGTYLLSSFIQPEPFYTAQNIKVLSPIKEMRFIEKVYYCTIIKANRYRYSSHGREANATLDSILVPAKVPLRFLKLDFNSTLKKDFSKSANPQKKRINSKSWKHFKYGGDAGIFEIRNGYYNKKPEHTEIGEIPFIGASGVNNGVTGFYSLFDIENGKKDGKSIEHPIERKLFSGNCITVANNGVGVGSAFYQENDFTCSHDVNVLYLKKGSWDKYAALLICTLIRKDKYRWDYGRKWRPVRMPDSIIKLPADKKGNPDWKFMSEYIKGLSGSAEI